MEKVLLITGAGGGLGSLIAQSEARNFGEIVLLGRSRSSLEGIAAKLRAAGASAHPEGADICDWKELELSLSSYPVIDGLVNAAGVLGPVAAFGHENWDEWKKAIEINLIGNAAACRVALPALLKSKRGKVVNFAGGGAASPRPHHSAYAASKAAIVRFTEIFSLEYPQLDANAIAPGAHNTGIWKTETHDKPPEKWADKKRLCSLVSFLLSEKSDGISGKFIHIQDKWEEFTPETTKSKLYSMRRVEPER